MTPPAAAVENINIRDGQTDRPVGPGRGEDSKHCRVLENTGFVYNKNTTFMRKFRHRVSGHLSGSFKMNWKDCCFLMGLLIFK